MRPDLTKSQRRRLRELAGIAYERELSRELTALEREFARWRGGTIDAHGLGDRIHQFHQGPNRRLFMIYTGSAIHVAIAAAIAKGIISEAEAGPEILELLRAGIEFARKHSDEDDEGAESGDGWVQPSSDVPPSGFVQPAVAAALARRR